MRNKFGFELRESQGERIKWHTWGIPVPSYTPSTSIAL